jgi:hypothetical protein
MVTETNEMKERGKRKAQDRKKFLTASQVKCRTPSFVAIDSLLLIAIAC